MPSRLWRSRRPLTGHSEYIPGGSLQVYDTAVLTEDNELTLALLHLGYTVTSPEGCRLTTEVMESWGDLYRQRLRWKRGAIENLFDYGLTRVTVRYWLRQLMTLLGIVVTFRRGEDVLKRPRAAQTTRCTDAQFAVQLN